MDTSTNKAESSLLLSLPAELRNRIYEYTLSLGVVVVSPGRTARSDLYAVAFDSKGSLCRNRLALLRTNKQIYNETANLFYFCNHFKVQCYLPDVDEVDEAIAHKDDVDDSWVTDLDVRVDYTMPALLKLLQKIPVTHGNAPIHITFAFGSVCAWDVKSGSTFEIFGILQNLHIIQATDARMRLDADMRVCIEQRFRSTPTVTQFPITLSISDPLPKISDFIVRLSEIDEQNGTSSCVHDEEDLMEFDKFFRGLRKLIKKSSQWKQVSEATTEGDGQENA
ncbi:hypothetical protein LTR17_001128 [Elasticomyces elasticus]|nr:hypothetical protein LTR17_001128 [Elasticomyces elasticus]